MAAYHKAPRPYLGTANPVIDDAVKGWRAELSLDDRLTLASDLWDTNIHEARVAAAKLLVQARIRPDDGAWALVTSWVPQFDGWAIADHVCGAGSRRLIADPTRIEIVANWTTSDHMWTKRAAMVMTLPWTKMNNPKPADLEIRERVLGWAAEYTTSPEWFIQKSTRAGICRHANIPLGALRIRRHTWLQQQKGQRVIDLTPQINVLSERIQPLREGPGRVLVAIAGPPASGKTTLSAELARRLNAQKCETAVVAQDGFHLDNQVLEAQDELGRKGAPHTFDGAGFVHLVRRLKERVDVAVPEFDRTRDIAIAGVKVVPASAEVVIVEGNYLLFDDAPWFNLAPIWTLSVCLNVPMAELRARLIARWVAHGLSPAAATRRATSNDIPNAQAVLDKALPATITLNANGSIDG
ncbi:hypothetical protein GQR58_018336 [Nymphon striatum]|nr:hypothetical protein GQR58_018336 [Nymphon striatum]